MHATIRGIVVFSLLFVFAGCKKQRQAEPQQQKTVEQKEQEAPKVECFPGCQLSEEGKCQTVASVADWNSVGQERVDCDPRCCDPDYAGAKVSTSGKPDADGDGIFDDRDECPDQVEDYDGFEDEDGCPEEDNDGDQIPDDEDVCPLDAEDVDGFQDDDGCPDR